MEATKTVLPDKSNIKTVLNLLRQRFDKNFSTTTALCEQHGHTTTWIPNQPPDGVVFVENQKDVEDVMQICAEYAVPLIPFGAGTSLEGHVNAPFGGITVDFSKMNRILQINPEDMNCVVEPGVTRKQLNLALRATGLFFPIDPGADASIGGMAATRASGTTAVRYGTMKDVTLGLKAVLPNGTILKAGGQARKTAAGYDLTRLLIGSEGTLGLITELTILLSPQPEEIQVASCSFSTLQDACNTVIMAIQCAIGLARIELLDALSVQAINQYSKLSLPTTPLLLLEFHGSSATINEQITHFKDIATEYGQQDFKWAQAKEERNKLWQARHDAYWAMLRLRQGAQGLSTDTCVPISQLANFMTAATQKADALNLVAPIVSHAGDGNFHMLILLDPADKNEHTRAHEMLEWLNIEAVKINGTCTGEHGIGQGKRKYLAGEVGQSTIDMMAAIKRAIDPQNILNPGKIWHNSSRYDIL